MPQHNGVSRRSFIQTLGASAAATAIADRATAAPSQPAGPPILGPDPIDIALRVNGKNLSARVDPATTLLQALRHNFNLTGSKEICDRGSCGGCSVLVDGKLVNSRMK